MQGHFWETIAYIVGGLFTVAIVAVIVSPKAQTGSVIQQFGNALTGAIGAAVAPVTQGGN